MKNIAKIIKVSKPLYGLLAIISVLIVIYAALELVTPFFSKLIVDEITAKVQRNNGDLNRLIYYISLAFILNVVGVVVNSVSQRLGDKMAGSLRKHLTEMFYNKVLTLPQSYFDSEISGKIVNQLSRGIFTVYGFMNNATNFILPTFLQAIFTIGAMAIYSVPIALLSFSLFPIYVILSYYSTKKWGEEEVKKNKIEDVSRGRIHEVISNIKLVKSYNTQKREFDFISQSLTKSNQIYARQSNSYHIFDFFRNLSLNIILTSVNVIVFINAFWGKLSFGEMVLILQLLNQVRRPLFAMSFILTNLQNAESGSKEFFEIMDLSSTEKYNVDYKKEMLQDPSIEFKNVSFKYETSDIVLNDISFKILPHEKVALVGHSGVGKSTIINLILKFYNPTHGDICMKDLNYKEINQQFIRHNIALVFQENELFSSTVRENVAYGKDVSDDEIIKALKMANAYNFVMKLPKGLDSEVGERGVKLSGGQKQRIQIARAILKNSPILILDEATSSLDAKSEREVQQALENLMKDRLVIIIAHRFSTIQNVNKVIVVDKGTIVDWGTPQELSTRAGIYKDLLNYQIEGNKKLLEQFEIY